MVRRPFRSWRARIRAGLPALLLGGLVLAACGSNTPPAPPPSQGLVQNRAVPNIALINDQGQTTSLRAFAGTDVVLAPFLTLCQDECPLVTGAFQAMQQDVKSAGLANKVVFVEITVDPGRDTPARLAAYSQRFGADWPLLTGTPANLRALWSFFGVSVAIVPEAQPPKIDWYTGKPLTYDVSHTDGFILLGANGHERFADANPPNLKGKLPADLKTLLNAGGLQNLDHETGPSWTLPQAVAALSWLVGQNLPQGGST
jgi:cytochrome oxidase Cu insertion factor (SCO1/SenC/PrrC family)